LQKHLWHDYVFKKQTVRELTQTYNLDRRIVREYLNQYEAPEKIHAPRIIYPVVDATYFGERKEDTDWCVAVVRDPEHKENLVWHFANNESTSLYVNLRDQLIDLGYATKSITADGFSGIKSAFPSIPYQMCLVHMERLVTRGTTRKPLLEAGQVLLALAKSLHKTNKKTFSRRIREYTYKYAAFLEEKTTNPFTGEKYWTHENLRRAFYSLLKYHNYLFTYTTNTHISKTTNSLEAHFSHIKDVLRVHRGLSQQQKVKVIHSILLASSIAPDQKVLDKIL
jgi:hypothetical protein